MLLKPGLDGSSFTVFASTDHRISAPYDIPHCEEVRDYSRHEPFSVLAGLFETRKLVRRIKPTIVVTTGAAPGLLCLFWGRVYGAKTVWIDSIANAEKLSLSGKIARRFADHTVTQWQHISERGDADFWGSLL